MSNVDRKAGPGGGPGDLAAAAEYEANAGRPGGPGNLSEAEPDEAAEEAEEES